MENLGEVVRMGLIRRRDGLEPEQFGAHWRGPHGTLAAEMPGLIRYHQNHRTDSYALANYTDRWELDGLSELWFPSLEAMCAAVASPTYAPVAADTPDVMTMPGIIAGIQATRLQRPDHFDSDKLMLIGTRANEVAPTAFARAWNASRLVENMPRIAGVVDTFVTHWESSPGIEVSRDDLPVDVIVEFWFDSSAALVQAARRLSVDLSRVFGPLLADAALYRTSTHVVVESKAESRKEAQ